MRIIEGEVVDQSNFPFIASIIEEGNHVCGASIISDRYILTAAHCTYSVGFIPRDLDTTVVSVGASKWQLGTKYRLSKTYAHVNYNAVATTNDIGLFKTAKKIEFTSNVQPVKLNKKDLPQESGLECIVIGWGYTSNGGFMIDEAADVLNVVKINTISTESCQKYYENIDERNICLTGTGRKGTCSGDSGGPLLYYDGGDLIQIGLVSYGGDCNNTSPEVHTSVSYFEDWITDSMRLLDSDSDDNQDFNYDHHHHDYGYSYPLIFAWVRNNRTRDFVVEPIYPKIRRKGGFRKANAIYSGRRLKLKKS
nr:chymotrypsin-1-like [Onthophagus taurus]